MTCETEENLRWLKERVSYSPETGVYKWLPRPRSDFKQTGRHTWWNREKAGTEICMLVDGYINVFVTKPDGERLRFTAHRLAFAIMTGAWPHHEIDHANGIRTDNQWPNIREATRQQNACNMELRKNKTSRFRGVYYDPTRGKWVAQISVKNKNKKLGRYDTEDSAAAAYERAARKAFGDFSATGRRKENKRKDEP